MTESGNRPIGVNHAFLHSALRGDVLNVDDLIAAIATSHLSDEDFTVSVFASGPDKKRVAVPSLSLVHKDRESATFSSLTDFAKQHSDLKRRKLALGFQIRVVESKHSKVYFFSAPVSTNGLIERFNQLQLMIEFIFASSLVAKNLWEQETYDRMAALEEQMRGPSFGLRDLAELISRRHLVNIALFEKKLTWDATFARASRKASGLSNDKLFAFFSHNNRKAVLEKPLSDAAVSGNICDVLLRAPNTAASLELLGSVNAQFGTPMFAIPIKRLNASSFNVREIVLIFDASSASKTTHFRLDAIQELIDRYLFLKYQSGRSIFITSLFDNSYLPIGTTFARFTDLQQQADSLVTQRVLPHLLLLTKAHSAAFLKYDPWSNRLIHAASPLEISAEAGEPPPISLNDWQTQLSAFTFINAVQGLPRNAYDPEAHDDVLERLAYVPNVTSMELGYAGLQRVNRRRATLSEICMPLVIGKTCYGVISLESPLTAAFDGDLEFLLLVQQVVGSTLSNIYRSNDHLWISIGMRQADLLHEIHNCAVRIVPQDGESATNKGQLLEHIDESLTLKFFDDDRKVDLRGGLMNYATAVLLRNRKRYGPTYQKFIDSFHVMLDSGVMVSSDFCQSTESILSILLSNCINHEALTDKIEVKVENNPQGTEPVLCIEVTYSYGDRFPQSLLECAFGAPYPAEGRDRLGLFLAGSIARSWGGWVHFERASLLTRRRAKITLPLPRAGSKGQAARARVVS